MAKRDPYSVLGVNRSASDEEIKRAYRKLARRHHPDVNSSSKSSESKFKELSEAYEILNDKEKRRKYDLFGHEGLNANFGGYNDAPYGRPDFKKSGFGYNFNNFSGAGEYGVFDDLFSDFFKSDNNRRSRKFGPTRGSDLEYQLTVDFSQSYHGVSAIVTILDRRINVHVPAGVDSGSRIRVPGQGAAGLRGGPSGDLYLDIMVAPHPFFRREGDNVMSALPITISEAILGAKIEVPSPDGRLLLRIPQGTQSGTIFRFRDKGFPNLKTSKRGDFFVTAQVMIPEGIDQVSKELLAEFERRNPMNPRGSLWHRT
jgi:curved DNA-binding protein